MKNLLCKLLYLFVKKNISTNLSDDELRDKIKIFSESEDFNISVNTKYPSNKKINIKEVNDYTVGKFRKIVRNLEPGVEDQLCDLVGDIVSEHKAMKDFIEEFCPEAFLKIKN